MRESGHKHENMQMNEIIWNVINAIKKFKQADAKERNWQGRKFFRTGDHL